MGAARSVDALGLADNAVLLVANGVEGALRLNIPVVTRRAQLLEPFGFVGRRVVALLGDEHQHVNTSDRRSDDDIMTVPFGGGLAVRDRAFMADARFTYRQTYYNDLLRTEQRQT